MNKLIEQIDKLINKKGSLKTPAYYIRGLLIDIVNYFEKKLNSLNNGISQINNKIRQINDKINQIKSETEDDSSNIIYAGYSNGSLDIKDVQKNYFIISNSLKYTSTVVIYSIKEIVMAKIQYLSPTTNRYEEKYLNMQKVKQNSIFVYSFNLFDYLEYDHRSSRILHSVYVSYKQPQYTSDYISVYLHKEMQSSTGLKCICNQGVVLSDSLSIYMCAFEYCEIILDVDSDITKISNLSSEHAGASIKKLLNNKIINGDYVKETDNDKLIFKVVKYGT